MRCIACSRNKPKAEFYRHSAMASGHLNKCKGCCRQQAKLNRQKNIDRYVAQDRARAMRPDRVAARMAYVKTKAGKASRDRTRTKWLRCNRLKRVAHIAVSNALRSGKLVRKPCFKCGNPKVQAHHPNYAQPLRVVWCCAKHHKDFHR